MWANKIHTSVWYIQHYRYNILIQNFIPNKPDKIIDKLASSIKREARCWYVQVRDYIKCPPLPQAALWTAPTPWPPSAAPTASPTATSASWPRTRASTPTRRWPNCTTAHAPRGPRFDAARFSTIFYINQIDLPTACQNLLAKSLARFGTNKVMLLSIYFLTKFLKGIQFC
jgi:hypothetical protein